MKTRIQCVFLCLATSLSTATLQAQYEHTWPVSTNETTASRSERFFSSGDLVGASVENGEGEKLGDISEVLFNPKTSQTFAIIGTGDNRNAIVPLQALVVLSSQGGFRNAEVKLNKTKAEFESAPHVVGRDWKKLDEEVFTRNILAHYQIEKAEAMGGATLPSEKSTGTVESGKKDKVKEPRQNQR